MNMQKFLKQARGYGVNVSTFTQSADMFKGRTCKRRPAYDDWLHRLSRSDRLPRGRYFRANKPGRPLYVVDEFWHRSS